MRSLRHERLLERQRNRSEVLSEEAETRSGARYRDLAFMLIMTVLMGLVISGVMTAWHGHGDRPFLLAWLTAFAVA